MEVTHGPAGPSDNAYKRGCHCPACTEAHRVAVAHGRATRLTTGRISHGTPAGYDDGCHCEQCRAAHRDRRRTERAVVRAARQARQAAQDARVARVLAQMETP